MAALANPLIVSGLVPTPMVLPTCALGWLLLALAYVDAKRLVLPGSLTIAVAVLGVGTLTAFAADLLVPHSLAALAGSATFLLIGRGYRALRQRDGLGEGDAWLLGALGFWVGPHQLADVVLIAALTALSTIAVARWRQGPRALRRRWPFGPHLAAAAYLVWLAAPLDGRLQL